MKVGMYNLGRRMTMWLAFACSAILVGSFIARHVGYSNHEAEALSQLEKNGWFVVARRRYFLLPWMEHYFPVTELGINGEAPASADLMEKADVDLIESLSHLQVIHIYGGSNKWVRREEEATMNKPYEELDSRMKEAFVGKMRLRKPNLVFRLHPRIMTPNGSPSPKNEPIPNPPPDNSPPPGSEKVAGVADQRVRKSAEKV